MRYLFMAIITLSSCIACNTGDSGTGNADENMGTINESTAIDTGVASSDTTPTTNNNVYNTDSASGQGNRYDTSNKR